MMRTPLGESLALERDNFMRVFIDQIEKEYN
jgi:hypothetical protein